METDERNSEVLTLQDYLRVGRRRWLTILATTAVLAGGAIVVSQQTEARYQASADVLLLRQNPLETLAGIATPGAGTQPERFMKTEAQVASVPAIARRVLEVTGVGDQTPLEFLASSSVTPQGESDLLRFEVTDADRRRAVALANAYANEYRLYRRDLHTAALERAQATLETRIRELRRAEQQRTPLYATLVDKQEQLRAVEAAIAGNAFVLRRAQAAKQIQPKPVRNVGLALAVGLMLGIVLAFVREALDTRVRSPEEIRAHLRIPLLARLPPPHRRLRGTNALAMLDQPFTVAAEAFRMLRTNLELSNLERDARVMMVTSARQGEGKSTTIANVAIALARAGRRVILVDLDLRRPTLDEYFGLDAQDQPGITDVAMGSVTLEEALVPVSIVDGEGEPGATRNGRVGGHGRLEVLTAGGLPPEPGEFVSSRAVAGIVDKLRDRADYVLLDTPALLQFGDAMVLSAIADAVVVVVRLNVARRPVLTELRRSLENSIAIKLGVVVTGVEPDGEFAPGAYRQLKGRRTLARANTPDEQAEKLP